MNSIGNKFNSLGADRFNRAVICKHLREDLKEFVKEWNKEHCEKNSWKLSVSKDGGTGIMIKISKFPITAAKPGFTKYDLCGKHGTNVLNILREDIWKKLMFIGNAYNYDNSDIMTDYFDYNYMLHLNFNFDGVDFVVNECLYKMF
jgi:hypothetical protein